MSAPGEDIRFPPFRLDRAGGRLLRGSDAIPLRPKTWAVLTYLAERPGMLVTKRELMDAVWSDVTVTESVMSKSIGELRVALGDVAKTPRFIETIHRRGFRFIAALATASAPAADDAPAALDGVFVGRATERRRLHAALENAHAGQRQIVFVTGSAGIGKSALVDAFLASPALRGGATPVWVLRGGSIEQHGPREAYMPVLEALERLAQQPDSSRLTAVLRRVAPTWLAQMPWLIGPDEAETLRQALQGVTSHRMLREFAALVDDLATDLTLVLVLEDLHWSDPSTVDLLSMLGQRPERGRLLVLGTYRPADAIVGEHVLMNAVRTLHVRRRCVEVALDDLSEEAVTAYLHARFPDNDFAPPLAPLVHAHTDGNPLFMVGVVDHLLSRGLILDTSPGWALHAPLEQIELPVPTDVRLLIEDQFRGLGPADHALVQAASVAGAEFTPDVVAAALGGDVVDVERRCDAFARTKRFLRVVGPAAGSDRRASQRYAFTHELYRQVVYADIADGLCMRLHQQIGQALEAAHGERRLDIAGQLALHFERSRDDARALHYLAVAAARARARCASREAIGYLEPALHLAAQVADDDARGRRELALRLALGVALSDLHGFGSERVRENYQIAAELCARIGNDAQLFDILHARWYLHGSRGERDETIALVGRLHDLARRLQSADHRLIAESVSLRTALYDGRFRECADAAERCVAGDAALPSAFGASPSTIARGHYAICLWFLGHAERAQATARAAVGEARASGHAITEAAVLVQAAVAELLCRNVAEGSELAAGAATLSAEHGFVQWRPIALVLAGWALIQRGQTSEGIVAVEQGIAQLLANGGRYFSGFAYGFLAEGHLCAGTIVAGLAAADAGLTVTQSTLDRTYEAELWRLKGELLLRDASPPEDAEACLLRALELARTTDAKSLELRAAASIARAWTARGRGAAARALLHDTLQWFEGRADTADLIDARRLIDGIGS